MRGRGFAGTRKIAIAVAAGVILFAGAGCPARGDESMAGVEVGQPAPEFELEGSDGKVYRLSDFVGKRAVVLAWFPKAFTGGWTAECKSLRESGESLRRFDVAYFAASVDDAETNRKFAESLELDYPILSDPDKNVARAYGVLRAGLFASRHTFYIGADGKILYIDRDVSPKTAGPDVAARLDALEIPGRQD